MHIITGQNADGVHDTVVRVLVAAGRGVVNVFNFTGDSALQVLGAMSSRADLKDKWSSIDGIESGFSRGIAVFDFGDL